MISHLDRKRRELLKGLIDRPAHEHRDIEDRWALTHEIDHYDIPAYCRREKEMNDWERLYD